MTSSKFKIGCFLSGLILSYISTYHNRYGEIELWEFHHQISMAVSGMIVALLIRISSSANFKIIGLYLSIGIISVQLIPISRSIFTNDSIEFSFSLLVYTVVAFLSSFIGSSIGEFILKSKYKGES